MNIRFRHDLCLQDIVIVKDILTSTGFFDAAPDEIDVAVELVQEALDKGCDDSGYHFVFAEDDNACVVAYACFGPIPCTIGSYDLYWIATHDKYRGQGIGKKIMEEVFPIVKSMGGEKLFLNTSGREMYKPTHSFYLKCGFDLEATLKNYYAKGDDCLIFSKDI